ncbi:MAG: nickel pincer cofactor biosynthesis protein LarC [Candidatus Heimdallarchaeota archaeon]|nr:MAG: nickel pincer cofactor biosynthesis protein LarC [Candidatus Gerdarchaeota archaeon]RLI73007.1 MAG: nickel pincer cofactor biosynthesis protein LarC [Candidatus Heimdallarchaeota archaeon]
MRQLIIDAQHTGISGDKFLAALLDLLFTDLSIEQANKNRLQALQLVASNVVKAAGLEGKAEFTLTLEQIEQFVHQGLQLHIHIKEPKRHLRLSDALAIIDQYTKQQQLSKRAKDFSKKAFHILFEAEAAAHNIPVEKTHLHEVGSLDTFLDILGAATLLDRLELFTVTLFVLPVALGSGTITFSHGTLPVPVPAVTEIAHKFSIPVMMGPLAGELTTPTGIAIIAALQKILETTFITTPPIFQLEKVGTGFGTKTFENTPNSLRLFLGSLVQQSYPKEEIAIIETNLDDCSGEVIGFLTERLFELGAKDVYLTPLFMKKGRPATKVSVLCAEEEIERFATEIMNQTSTIGVRILRGTKLMLPREIKHFQVVINGKHFALKGKIAYTKTGAIAHFKPEFEDVKTIVNATGLTITEVLAKVRQQMANELEK